LQEGIQDVYPLTPAQQGILYHCLDESLEGVYINQLCLKVNGFIDLDRFEQAWNQVVARHDVFRTAFFWEELSSPLQVVKEKNCIPFLVKDWSHLSTESQKELWDQLLVTDRKNGFDLQEAPLSRLNIVKMADDHYDILWTFHHLLLDGWSCPIVLNEVIAFYRGENNIPDTPAFSEFVAWIESSDQEDAMRYWKKQLSALEEPSVLPIKTQINRKPSLLPDEYNVYFSEEETNLIRRTAKQLNLTESTLLLGVWLLTVYFYTSKSDVVVGMAVSGRSPLLEDFERRVGMHMNTVPVRTNVSPTFSITQWLQTLQQDQLEMRMHEHTSLADILSSSRVSNETTLFDNLFVYENYPSEELVHDQFTLEIVKSIEKSHYPLTLMVLPNELTQCKWIFDSAKLELDQVSTISQHYQHILLQILADPNQSIGSLEWITKEELSLIESWNHYDRDYDSELLMYQLFEKQVEKTPDQIAVHWGNDSISYRDLNERANQLAHFLIQKGVETGDFVAVGMPRSVDMLVSFYAIWKVGAAYVPIDLTYPKSRLDYILQDSHAKLLISTSHAFQGLPEYKGDLLFVDRINEIVHLLPKDNLALVHDPDSLAYVVYTSGSTGKPKGVMITHRSAVHLMNWAESVFGPEERKGVLASTSICFDLSVFEMFFPLSCGGLVVGAEDALDLSAEIAAKGQITLINTVPSAITELLELGAIPSSVTTINLAGEPLTNQLAQSLYRLEHIEKVYNLYGPSEDTTYSTCSLVKKGCEHVPTIGRPISQTEAFVFNSTGKLVPVGFPGELYLGGRGLAKGYLNQKELTAEKFVDHPFRKGLKLYRTGDFVQLQKNGELKFLGRLDHQVKLRGYRIELSEIEHVLEKHEKVKKALVIAKEQQLIAYLLCKEKGVDYGPYLAEFVPSYMIPSNIVELEEFPLTPNGKIDRKALPEIEDDHQMEVVLSIDSPLEEIVKGIWQEVLGRKVSTSDNFFALGGHSLLATQVISRISRIFQVTMPIRSLFQSPTVKLLAHELNQMLYSSEEEVVQIKRQSLSGKLPLSPSQKRVWFLEQILPVKHVYHLPYIVKVTGDLDRQCMASAFQKLVDRHPAFRTAFLEEQGAAYQVIKDEVTIQMEEFDVREVNDPDQEAKLQIAHAIEVPFSLDKAPLVRMNLYQVADDQFYLCFLMHHLVADGWSLSILSQELFHFYEALKSGEDANLPELPLAPSDIAIHLESLSKTTSWERKLSYWKEKLTDLKPVLLPTDFPRPNEQMYEGQTHYYQLSPLLSQNLKEVSHEQGTTLYMVLVTAFQALLSRYTNQMDIPIGSPIAGREDENIEGLIGFFVETIIIRTDLSKAETFEDLLQQVREVSLEAYANGQVSFEKVVDAVLPDRKLSDSPLFQIMFAMQSMGNEIESKGNLAVQHIPMPLSTAKFDLTVTAVDQSEGIFLTLEYNKNLFAAETIHRFMRNFEHVLQVMAKDLEQSIHTVSLLSSEEEKLLASFHEEHEQEIQDFQPILAQIASHVQMVPDGLAVVEDQKTLSYIELEQQSTQLALFLRSIGVGKHDRVAICAHRCPEMIVAQLGVMKIGACYVPLDPSYPLDRLAFMIEDSGASILLTQNHLTQWLEGLATTTFVLDKHPVSWDHMPTNALFTPLEENQLAYMVYTSGSTGLPKGVCITHGGLHNLVQWHQHAYQVTIEDRTTMLAGPAFDASVWEIWPSLAAGATLVIPNEEKKTDPTELRDWLIAQGITISFIPTPLLAQLVAIPWSNAGSLRYLLTGGDQLHVYPPKGFPVTIVNHYGPTENTVVATAGIVPAAGTWSPSIGKAIMGVKTYVLDEKGLQVPIGVPGELCIGGNQLAARYHQQSEKTSQAFIQHPTFGRLYKTGDRVRMMVNGNIHFQGRMDRQVSIRGYRVELGEIEATLVQIPEVNEAVVMLINENLVAYVVMEKSDQSKELRDKLAEKLPVYMIPKLFIALHSLPLTANGKLDRSNLPEPNWDELVNETTFVAPQTKVEYQLAEIWRELLHVEQISIHDNFFQLGGDSIISIQMVARAKHAGIAITAKQVFSHQTICELSTVAKVTESVKHDQGLIVGEVPLTPIQKWFFEQQMENMHHFNQAMLITVAQPLSIPLLTRAMEMLMEHHDAFRLRFVETEKGWRQSYSTISNSVPLQMLDLSSMSEDEQLETIKQVGQRTQTSLHLQEGPLFRAIYFKRGYGYADKLLLAAHHLIVDGVSWRILLEDLSFAYQQLGTGKEPMLPAKTTSYQVWSNILQKNIQSENWTKEVSFWMEQQVSTNELPPIFDDTSKNLECDAKQISFRLSKKETKQLLTQSFQAYRARVSELLIASLVSAYHAWSGNNAVSIDLEGHGREETLDEGIDLSRTIGWFTTIYPIRFEITGDNWEQIVPNIQEKLSLIGKQGISYGMLKHLKNMNMPSSSAISFNYLGQIQSDSNSIWTSSTSEGIGSLVDPVFRRPYALDVWSVVQDDQLEVKFIYDPLQFSKAQVTSWITLYQQQLNQLIDHCMGKKIQPMLGDFPLAKLTSDELLNAPDLKNVRSIYPLSPLQEGMLFHSLYAKDEPAYVVQMKMMIKGKVDLQVFQAAWKQVMQRHPQLSVSLWWENVKQAHQIAWKEIDLPIVQDDWTALNEEEKAEALANYLEEDHKRAFDLTCPPLMRIALFSITPNQHQVVWSYHHTLLDGWSMPIVLEEWLQIYQSLVERQPVHLPAVASYEAYFRWMLEQDEELAKSYWSHQLADAKPAQIAVSSSHSKEKSFHEEWAAYLSSDVTENMKQFAKKQKVTINTVIQAAWGIFLAAYSGQTDLMYGTTVSGRPGSLHGVEQIVGPFINSIPVRIHLKKDWSIEQYLVDLQQKLKDSEEYAYVPLTKIAEWAGAAKEEPLFQYLLVMENYQMRSLKKESLQISELRGIERSHYPLVLVVAPGESMFFKWMYDTSKFNRGIIERFMRLFSGILQQFVSSNAPSIADLNLLLEEEKAQLQIWNRSDEIAYPLPVLERIVAHATNDPNHIAVKSIEGQLSYGELYQKASQLAYYLGLSGVKSGDCVGVLLDRSIDLITSLVAIHLAGAAYMPIDPSYPEERIKWMIQNANLDVVITNSSLQLKCISIPKNIICMDVDQQKWASMPAIHTRADQPQNLAYVVYTSGSTGVPKGVEITQKSLQHLVDWHQQTYELTSSDKCSMLAGVGFDASVWEIWPVLASGATLMIMDENNRLSPSKLKDWLISNDITISFVPTLICEELFHLNWPSDLSLRVLLTGGDQLRQYPPKAFPIKVVNHYGPTENTVVATAGIVEEAVDQNIFPSIGFPISGTKVEVVNEFGQVLPIGVPGELWLSGTSLANGYKGQDDLTKEKFTTNSLLGRVYQTGDIVRYGSEGQLFFIGRKDDQVQLRGFRMELGEIEAVLLKHPAVKQVVVLTKEQDNGTKALFAYILADQDAETEWRELVKKKLPHFMQPSGYKCLSEFPVNANGKIDKKELSRMEVEKQFAYVAPNTPMERRLVSIWDEVLATDQQIGIEDNFFQLGGHSLLATQVISRINELYRCQLPLRALFENPTITELIEQIKQNLLRKASVRKG
jgi:amino acid adenylation domain-containing protein/non-ribosomal peptide synthase protein (TIGR01720 family)